MNKRRRKAALKHRQIEQSETQPPAEKKELVFIPMERLRSWDKKELVKYARYLGINASSRWREETIIRKIEEVKNGR